MSLRQRLLVTLSLTVVIVAAAAGWMVSLGVGRAFEQLDRQQTAALAGEFQRALDRRGSETAAALDQLAASDPLRHIAFTLSEAGSSAPYLTIAVPLAQAFRLDYLEVVAHDGRVLSSAQWPARFGSREPAIVAVGRPAFLQREELPDSTVQLGLFAARVVSGSNPALYLIGGRRIDSEFLRDLPVPAGSQVYLYRNPSSAFDAQNVSATGQGVEGAEYYQPLVEEARTNGRKASAVVYLAPPREESVNATAIPLQSGDGSVLAVLLVANSRQGMLQVQRQVRRIVYGMAVIGILLAVGISFWIAARIASPVEQLMQAVSQVAAGDWGTHVDTRAPDAFGELARSFNAMTRQLGEQRERLVQRTRLAAWRQLAGRLAQELKNPIFPLQITVEKMVRARRLSHSEFDKIFAESTATLQADIVHLKTIVEGFSDFAEMPGPQAVEMDARDAVRRIVKLYGPVLEEKRIELGTAITSEPLPILGDAEQLHRVLSNLVLNATDAMPVGGRLTISAGRKNDAVRISIADSGVGLAPEEAERLFTPYYTTKPHGAGLGLAIVQSVVADHGGMVTVESPEDGGTRFVIGLPLAEAEPRVRDNPAPAGL